MYTIESYVLKEHIIGKDKCTVFYSGTFYDDMSKEYIKNLISNLKNTLKHHAKISKEIQIVNKEINDEIMKGCYNKNANEKKEFVPKSGYVYVLQCTKTKYFKIGCTSRQNPDIRIKEIQIYNPTVEVYYLFGSKDLREEKQFHVYFESKKISGEWFDLDSDDLDYLYNFYYGKHENK